MAFITFEGIDGSGKSTQIRLLGARLEDGSIECTVLREPGGTDVSERVRSLLLDVSLRMEPMTELLLFSAARSQLCRERIIPMLAEGRVVICDRFYDSTVAYQGGGREVGDFDWLRDFNRRVTGGLVPDRTYLLDVTGEIGAARRAGREDDRLESGGVDFFERIRQTYLRIASEEPERVKVIDGARPRDEIAAEIWEDASRLLAEPAE
ncbi:MAG: dTMP kinase [Rhodothermia bacterium]|nr:dTMP kinase [Rhodothermia bacterium]